MFTNKSYSGLIGNSYDFIQAIFCTRFSLSFILCLSLCLCSFQSYSQTIVVIEDISLRAGKPTDISLSAKLYPNPAHERMVIEIEGAEIMEDITIYDLSGRLLQNIKPEQAMKTFKLNVLGLPAGTYVLRVKTEQGAISRKFTVVKR